ncbi:MAG TPA: LLM class F420-dependent oxidoreductase [Dehalococcoidia bacterium]|nr:LLM class F420-dependent oxidoreductase [Dehalococcoidia bacterium]
MQYGLSIFPTDYTVQPDELAKRAEERGFESLWFPEHTHIPVERKTPWPGGPDLPREYNHTYDPFVACSVAAAATTSLKVATGICLIIQHDPIVLAKTIATVDRLSGGRFIFGIGAGWNREEIENHGTEFKTRFRLLRERVLAMKALWTQEQASFHGQFVDFDPVYSYPKPLQQPHPPIVMGGDGATTFDRVVQFCDGWLPISRGGALPAGLGDKVIELKRRLEAAGRDPASVSITLFGAAPNRDQVDELQRMGLDRAIFALPVRPAADVWPVLDEYAELIK